MISRYKSLIDNVLTKTSGSFSTGNYLEMQVRPNRDGSFVVVTTDGYKYIMHKPSVTRTEAIKMLRTFN